MASKAAVLYDYLINTILMRIQPHQIRKQQQPPTLTAWVLSLAASSIAPFGIDVKIHAKRFYRCIA